MKTINQISAGGIVMKKDSNPQSLTPKLFLICRHSQHKGWVFPKGLVGDKDSNETMKEAALREVEEEGGVKATIINETPVKTGYSYVWQGNQINKTVYYYLMEYISGDPQNHDWEMSEAKFVMEKEVLEILTYPSDKDAFNEIKTRIHDR